MIIVGDRAEATDFIFEFILGSSRDDKKKIQNKQEYSMAPHIYFYSGAVQSSRRLVVLIVLLRYYYSS